MNVARLRRENAREDLKQGCLAGAVRTNEADDLACLDVEGDIREHNLIGILLVDRINPQQRLIVCLLGNAGSLHRKRRIASDWRIWRGQMENSVHAQFPRHSEYCAELGRRASDGESACPRSENSLRSIRLQGGGIHNETRLL